MEKRKGIKASMTVEAVFIMLPILFTVFWCMKTAISFYQETKELEKRSWIEMENPAEEFRRHFLQKRSEDKSQRIPEMEI